MFEILEEQGVSITVGQFLRVYEIRRRELMDDFRRQKQMIEHEDINEQVAEMAVYGVQRKGKIRFKNRC